MSIIASDGLHYNAVQINGQKIVGPPLNFAVPQPSDNLEIFICNIPRDLSEEFLIKLFSRIGPVYELRLLMCFSGFNRGIAYLRYYNKADVSVAVKCMDLYQVRPSWFIRVQHSLNTRELLLGKIKQEMPDELIKELCEHISQDLQITIMRREQVKLAILTFQNHRKAALARRQFLFHLKYFGSEPFVVWFRRNAQKN